MTYAIIWSESAFRKFEKLDGQVRYRIAEKLQDMTDDPFLTAKKLVGANLYAVRVGEYRVIMGIERGRMVIVVIDGGHRSKIYKNL